MNLKTQRLMLGPGRYLFQRRKLSFKHDETHLHLWTPASGKLTVATELAKLTRFKLFHNHVSIQFVKSIFEFGTKPFGVSLVSIGWR